MQDPLPALHFNTRLAYRSSLRLRIFIALILLYSALKFLGSTLVPPVYSVSTEVVLPANISDSWQALTEFTAYAQWNPYITSVEGEFSEGEKLALTLVTSASGTPRNSHAILSEIQPGKRFAWQGQQFPLPGISHTRHVFALEKVDATHTRLLHFEEFRGLGVALDASGREREAQRNEQAFMNMNNALRMRLEKL